MFKLRSSNVSTVWITYFLGALAASGVFVVAGWRSKQTFGLAGTDGRNALPVDPLWGEAEIDLNSPNSQTDIAAALRLALKRLAPVMANRAVHAEVAAPTGLLVRMRGAALADLLEDLVAAAIHAAPASRLLLTAAAYGDRIYVGVTDDVPGADPAVRAGSARSLMERIAMRGGALDIDVRPNEGTTMTLRLSAVGEDWQSKRDRTPPEPAKGPSAPLIAVHARIDQLR
jgi:hypothetical protein